MSESIRTAYLAIWPGLLPSDQRAFDAPTDDTIKYGILKDPEKRAARRAEAMLDWETDQFLSINPLYGYVRGACLFGDGMGPATKSADNAAGEDDVLDWVTKVCGSVRNLVVLTQWTFGYVCTRNLIRGAKTLLRPDAITFIGTKYWGDLPRAPEFRTLGNAMRTPEFERLLPYNAGHVTTEALERHLVASVQVLKRMYETAVP